jgi:D-alanine-D-alanine ligase
MKKTIALITGGYSGEAEISYKSAQCMASHIDGDRWDCYVIDIHPDGWHYVAPGGGKVPVDKNDFSITVDGKKITFEAILVGLHGTPGEDGKLQGYFDCLNIPYTSCGCTTSALTFNKRYTVAVAAMAGLHVARSMHLFNDVPVTTDAILQTLQLPVFVKPNNGGSSIGMSKVNRAEELEAALQKAFKEDSQVLVEEFIAGREFSIGVFKHKGEVTTLPITEIISKKEFFDYEAKYQGASEEVTPANIDAAMTQQINDAAKKVYQVFRCNGVVRIDFIYHAATGQPYMLEVNTVPGQTDASLVPQQVRAMGWTQRQFYSALLDECLQDASVKSN